LEEFQPKGEKPPGMSRRVAFLEDLSTCSKDPQFWEQHQSFLGNGADYPLPGVLRIGCFDSHFEAELLDM
jgi:hypothetical protein